MKKIMFIMLLMLVTFCGCVTIRQPSMTEDKSHEAMLRFPPYKEYSKGGPLAFGDLIRVTCADGWVFVSVTGIPQMTDQNKDEINKQELFCVHDLENRCQIGVYQRYVQPGGGGNPWFQAWRMEAGCDGCMAEWDIWQADHLASGNVQFGVAWREHDAWVMNLDTGDWQHLESECSLAMDEVAEDINCQKWGWSSVAMPHEGRWGCNKRGEPQVCGPYVLVYGHYSALSADKDGPAKTQGELKSALSLLKSYWPGVLATRNWCVDGRMHSMHPWKRGIDKFDLNTFDEQWFQRLKWFTDIHRQLGVICFLDLFDHWRMIDSIEWLDNPLNPENNYQVTFGVDARDPFINWYKLDSNPQLKEWVRKYAQAVARTVQGNPWVIISSGNEMVSGEASDRFLWHKYIGEWIQEVNPGAFYTTNDEMYFAEVHQLPTVGILSIHGVGGLCCDGPNAWNCGIDWNYLKQFNKLVFLDNDGMWYCRGNIQFVVDWWKLAKPLSGIYGAKGPWPYETSCGPISLGFYYRGLTAEQVEQMPLGLDQCSWESYGKPLMEALRSNF